jgi:hypothetical protein
MGVSSSRLNARRRPSSMRHEVLCKNQAPYLVHYITLTPLHSNHAQGAASSVVPSIAGSPAPVLCCLPVHHVLFQACQEMGGRRCSTSKYASFSTWGMETGGADVHTILRTTLKEDFKVEHGIHRAGDERFFKLSLNRRSKKSGRGAKKICQTTDQNTRILFFHSFASSLLNSEMLSWPNSPLRSLKQVVYAGRREFTPLPRVGRSCRSFRYSTHVNKSSQNSLLNSANVKRCIEPTRL